MRYTVVMLKCFLVILFQAWSPTICFCGRHLTSSPSQRLRMSPFVAPKSLRYNRLRSRLSLCLFARNAESWILACETVACERAVQSPFACGSRVTSPNGANQSWATATCKLSTVSLSLLTLAPDLSFEESSRSSPFQLKLGMSHEEN